MSLTPGTRLGPYEILSAIGAGGMGEVYRAKDTRLGRDVAIKVLPESFAADPDRRARFEREAQAVAALSHPNIVAIFDTGVHDGQVFVVMELLSGQTLRERLTGPLPARKAVDIAVQIARGLGAAHSKGIVHRDLKPDNVFLLDDGQVKILDFGLARQASPASGATETRAMTDAGTVLGTVGYMAPEQVRGQAVDARTDLFAFGAVLYEMLSGTRAFQRDTAADTMTAILTFDPPELSPTRADLPPALDRIIRHCLEKNANERFQSARDIAFALDALSGTGMTHASGAMAAMPATAHPGRWRWPAAAAILAIAALAAGVWIERQREPAPSRVKFDTVTWEEQSVTAARFGADGKSIYFSAYQTGQTVALFAIAPGSLTPKTLGEAGTQLLAVSPAGQELLVLTGAKPVHHRIFAGTLARMSLDGAARPWMEDVSEADYGPGGSSVAIIHVVGDRWRLEYPIGTVLYTAPSGYISDLRVSPDGTHVAFLDHPLTGDDRGSLKVVDRAGKATQLSEEFWGEEGVAWSPDSRTVFFSPANSNAQIDVAAVKIDAPRRLEQIVAAPGTGNVADVAADGRLLMVLGELRFTIRALLPGEKAEREFQWLDFSIGPYLSRDGKHMVFSDLSASAGVDYAVAIRDIATGRVARLGPGTAVGVSPDARWAAGYVPSAQQIVFYPLGPGDPVALARPRLELNGAMNWFADGKRVLYCGSESAAPPRCWIQAIGPGAPEAVTSENVTEALLAPDDRTLLIRTSANAMQLMTLGGGAPVDAKGFTPRDRLLTWTPDRSVLVLADARLPTTIDRVDPVTGQRTRVHAIELPARMNDTRAADLAALPGGDGYAFAVAKTSQQIFIVTRER